MKPFGLSCAVVVALMFSLTAPVVAQESKPATTNMDILAQKLKADKKLLVAQAVGVTDEEGKGFWPIYDAYQADLEKINQRLQAGIESYAKDYNANSMTDAKATELTREAIAIEENLVSLKKTYVARLAGVLSATKVARYIQVENKVRAQINYELAAGIPFVR